MLLSRRWRVRADIYGGYTQFSIRLLIGDRALITLPSLELHDLFERAFGVLYYGRAYVYGVIRNERVASQRVVSRADFVHVFNGDGVSYADIAQTRYGEDVSFGEEVAPTDDRGDDVVRRL